MSRRGFTFAELLCVIVIVASLFTILLPVFQGAKKSATGVVCLGNLRQIGLAAALYVNDHDDHYPRSVNGVERESRLNLPFFAPRRDEIPGLPTHSSVYSPYIGKGDVWRCPNDQGGSIRLWTFSPRAYQHNDGTSYLLADLLEAQTASGWEKPSDYTYAEEFFGWHRLDHDINKIGNMLRYDGHVESKCVTTYCVPWTEQ